MHVHRRHEHHADSTERLEEAIRKMTSLPAQRIGFKDIELIRERHPLGIEHVLVLGEITLERDQYRQALAARILHK
jgi:ribosomal protein L32E